MTKRDNNLLEATVKGITNTLANAACNLLLYIGMYRYVTLLSWSTNTTDNISDNVSDADVQYLIGLLLKAIQHGDERAINQFHIDFNRLCSTTTDTSYCTLASPLDRKKQVLEDFLTATSTLPINNALAVISQLNQSVGNHALNVVVAQLMQQGEFNHGILQQQMQAHLYQNGSTFGLYYCIPMYEVKEHSTEKNPDKNIIACLELTVNADGTLRASHNITLQDTTRVEPAFSFLQLFLKSQTQHVAGTPCTVRIEDVTEPDCNDWATLDLI